MKQTNLVAPSFPYLRSEGADLQEVFKMSSAKDMPVVLERKVVSGRIIESKLKIGKEIVNIRSTFDGNKRYSDILYELAYRKLSA
jgi:hypothetical protein